MATKIQLTGFLKETLGCVRKYLDTKNIVEIMINKPYEVVVETTRGEFRYTRDDALSLYVLETLCHNLANATEQRLDDAYPVLSTYIPVYGYRFQAVVGSCVDSKISISIRIGNVLTFPLSSYFPENHGDIGDISGRSGDEDHFYNTADVVANLIELGKNFLVSGGTSTGKTTCVNSLIKYIPKHLRVITLENMRELTVPHANRVHLTASESKSLDIYKILSNSILRMRPDRIIIGELTLDLTEFYLRLSSTGHDGTLTTVHAESPVKALDAVLRNLLLAGSSFDVSLMDYIVSTIHYVIQLKRSRRRAITAAVFKTGLSYEKEKGATVFTCSPLTI